jgi:hypothetical protein
MVTHASKEVLMLRSPVRLTWALALLGLACSITCADVVLKNPQGLCFDSGDNLYVADTGNHRILKFSPDLELLWEVGAEGSGAGQFREPTDVAVDSNGRIIVADARNHRIQILSESGSFISSFGKEGKGTGEFNYPANVTIDDRDNIIVTDRFNHRLCVFDRNGQHMFTLANFEGEKSPERIAVERKWKEEEGRDPNEVTTTWQNTDVGQLNEPGGTFCDAKLKRLFLANGWNCRAEVFDYDSATGIIKRRGPVNGIVWGWWITRNITGDDRGRLLGLNTAFGNIEVLEDRANLNSKSKIARTVTGGSYGAMHDITDIAQNSKGEFAVADSANNRIVMFDRDFSMPGHPKVLAITSDSATIEWQTRTAAETAAICRESSWVSRTPGHEAPWTDGSEPIKSYTTSGSGTDHTLTIKGLEPAKRYFYKLKIPDAKTIPGAGWSREYCFATFAEPGKKAYVDLPVKVLLVPNVINTNTVKEDTPYPEPMPKSDYKLYTDALDETQLFYWCNSQMRYFLDYDLYIDDTMYRKDNLPEGIDKRYADLPGENQDESFKSEIEKAGRKDKVYYGQIVIECERVWDEGRKAWRYQGSGGGTYGVEWPTPGRSSFLGGSDIAWLTCHEYKHQFESQHGNSGMETEDDRSIFCHFSPKYDNPDPKIGKWELDTAYDHGEHWDGIAYQLRVFTPLQYMRNMYGEIRTAKDADNDGIPDDDPKLPLDEKRFGSDPAKKDTDSDGLDEMGEILSSRWVTAMLTDLRQRTPRHYIRPNPNKPDTDGDGVTDGKDKYPIYPYQPVIKKGTVAVDGDLGDWKGGPQVWMDDDGIVCRVHSCHDAQKLYYGFEIEGDWRDLALVLDQDADGFYVGNDNLYINISPDPEKGPSLQNARMHLCNKNRWPYFDDEHSLLKPEDLDFASSAAPGVQRFEIAIPRNPELGLDLAPGEEVGLMVYIGLPERGSIAIFEPYNIFDSVLE